MYLHNFLDGCPDGDGYVTILEKCYYIEKEPLNYADAMLNCQNHTGLNNYGSNFIFTKINDSIQIF